MLNDITVILVTICIVSLSIYLFSFSINSFKLTKLNLISYLFYKDILVFSLVGVLLVVLSIDEKFDLYFWAISNQVSDLTRYIGWIAVLYFMLAFPIGLILGNFFVCKSMKPSLLNKYIIKNNENSLIYFDDSLFISVFIFSIISLLSILYVYASLHTIPLMALLKGADSSTLAVLRGDAKIEFSGSTIVRDIVALKLAPLLSYIAYAQSKLTGRRKWKYAFYCLFILTLPALTYNLQKAPFLFYLIGFILIKVLLGDKVGKKTILYSGIVLIVGLTISFVAIMGVGNIGHLIDDLSQRILIAQTSAIFLSFEYFPKFHDFLGVSSVSGVISNLMSEDKVYYGRALFELYNPDAVESGKAGYIVGNLIAESWALFGLWGALLLPIWSGFFVSSISNILLRLPKHGAFIGLYAYIALNLSLTGGVAQFLNSIVLLSPVFYVTCLLSCSYIIKKAVLRYRKETEIC
ncbi:oligosaccharide repeat unit polymerase [Vibrio breoganii]